MGDQIDRQIDELMNEQESLKGTAKARSLRGKHTRKSKTRSINHEDSQNKSSYWENTHFDHKYIHQREQIPGQLYILWQE